MRRLIDIVASFVGLVFLSPVMGFIAAAIRRESGSPVLFRQERIGRFGRPFTLLKFRTMRPDTSGGPQITASGDPRITAVGRRLRATKADELPQLWNVLRGDMSLVGPRPEVRRYVEEWPEEERQIILSVRPGITDPVTIGLRREEELLASQPEPENYYVQTLLPAKVNGYVQYVRTRGLSADIRLLLKTLRAMIQG